MINNPPEDYTDPAELLAVVDANDNEIGAARRDIIHRDNLLHRAIHVFVFASDGRLLLQQRSSLKDCFPLHWECVGGHLSPGEDYTSAAIREAGEELGLHIPHVTLLATLCASPETGYEFIRVYQCVTTETPQPNPHEIIDTCWFTRQQLIAEIESGARLFSPVLLLSLRKSGLLTSPWPAGF